MTFKVVSWYEKEKDRVRVEISVQTDKQVPYVCGRLILRPAEWDIFRAMLCTGPGRFLDNEVHLELNDSPLVIEAMEKSRPGFQK